MKLYPEIDNPSLLKLLAVSFAYPPIALPRSTQVARLLRNLKASTVLVCGDEPGVRKDSTLEAGAEEELNACLRVPFQQRFIDRLSYRFCRQIWNQKNMTPDMYSAWKPAVIRTIGTFMKEASYQPEVLVTFGKPFTSHLIGLELKQRYNLPWLAHFSDPWVDNPFNNYDNRIRRINLSLEKQVVEKADILAFTSDETIELVFEKYPVEWKRKTRIIPQTFDTKLFPERSEKQSSKLIVRYLGDFYGPRTPLPLQETLRIILERKMDDLADVCFELIGTNSPEIAWQNDNQNLPESLLLVRSAVGYRESLQLMVDADGLLVIDAPAHLSVFLPSKLIDYAGAARPVLGIVPPGAAAVLIQQLGGFVANPTNTEEMIDSMLIFLKLLRHRRQSNHFQAWGTPNIRNRYEVKHVAELFLEMLHELGGKSEQY